MRGPAPRTRPLRLAAAPARSAYVAGWAWLLAATVAFLHGTLDAFAWVALALGGSAAGAALVRVVLALLATPQQLGVTLIVLSWPAATGIEMLRVVAGAPAPVPATLVASALVIMEVLAAVALPAPAVPARPARSPAAVPEEDAASVPAPVPAPKPPAPARSVRPVRSTRSTRSVRRTPALVAPRPSLARPVA